MPADLGNETVGTLVGDLDTATPALDPLLAGSDLPRTTGADATATGYCLWEFDGQTWILRKDRCHSGHVPSAPPSAPGRFRGQLRAVMAVPATATVGEPTTTGRE